MLFISHDLAVVRHVADRIAVMYLGKIVEIADGETLCAKPKHPYTQALFSAIPLPDLTKKPDRQVLKGEVPSPVEMPTGCVFASRCPYVKDKCRSEPELRSLINVKSESHQVACHFAEEISSNSLSHREAERGGGEDG